MSIRNRSSRNRSDPRETSSPKPVDSVGGGPGVFHVMAVLAIAAVCLAAYSNSLHGPFTFDDAQNIEENQGLRWTQLSWSGVVNVIRQSPDSSRPVANLSFALNYLFGQYDVWGYHVVNVGIHLVSAMLVYLLALAMVARAKPRDDLHLRPSPSHWIALTAALIFVSHPIQTQAVTYIVQRMTSLCTLFYLAALLLYIYGRTTAVPRRRWTLWAGGLVCWVLALGSKQIAATLPLTILLYEWYFFQDLSISWAKKNARFGLLVLGLLGLVAWAYMGNEALDSLLDGYATREFTMGQRLLTQFRVVMLYLSLLVFPHPSRLNLNHHVIASESLVEPITTLISVLGVFGLLGLAVYLARRRRLVSFCLLWFFLNLVIESSVIALEMVFEHRLYLPMFGFSLLVAWLLYDLAGVRSRWAIGVAAAICLLLAVGTYQRNRVWQDDLTLWSDVVSKSPLAARAQNNLGVALYELERFEEAGARFQDSLRIDPDYAKAHHNLGKFLAESGRPEEAVVHFEEALRSKPDFPEAHNNWGIALATLGRPEEAVVHYQEAVRIRPDHAKAHNNWGNALTALGRPEEAVVHYQEALEIKPDYANAHNNIAWLWATCPDVTIRDGGRALAHAKRAVQLAGDENAQILDSLSAAYAESGDFDEAVRWQEKAVQVAPEKLKGTLVARLKLYEQGQPYRESN